MARTNVVIDISHNNSNPDLAAAQQAGILGIIHKATQGTTFTDPIYAANLQKAQTLGLLWGAYHFGNGDDGISQAEFFLNTVKPEAGTILVLDFESHKGTTTMSLDEARDFVTHIHEATGVWPGLYGGSYLKEQLGSHADPTLLNCWLWLAQYGPTAVLPAGWTQWTLWQYTDGQTVPDPAPIPGLFPCDRDYYFDTADTMQAKWSSGVGLG
jgi:lysozyme